MFTSPGEIAFQIGAVKIHYYGITMALAMLVGIFTADKISKKFYPTLDRNAVFDVSPSIIIGAILGARLYYCLLCLPYFIKHPIKIFQIWQGGMSIQGGILGGLILGVIYAKRHNLPVLKLCDVFSYGLCLGQAIGRWGNFFNSEAFGYPTNIFCKLFIPITQRPVNYLQYSYFHPTFLYESICDILIFFILYFVIRKWILLKRMSKNSDGMIFFSYLILYSVVRIVIEQFRLDSVLNIFGIPIAQLVCVLTIFFGVLGLRFKLKNN